MTIYGSFLLVLEYAFGFSIPFARYHFLYDRKTMEQIGIRVSDHQPAFLRLMLQVRRSSSSADPSIISPLVLLLDVLLFDLATVLLLSDGRRSSIDLVERDVSPSFGPMDDELDDQILDLSLLWNVNLGQHPRQSRSLSHRLHALLPLLHPHLSSK